MKKIIVILVALGFINKLHANNDSMLVCNDSIIIENCASKSNYDSVTTENIVEIAALKVDKFKNKKLGKTKKPNKISTNNKPEGFGDFLNDLWDIISSPFKPVWGHYEEENMNNEGPYFLFNRSSGGASYVKYEMDRMRAKIRIVGSSEQLLYEQIFITAGTDPISSCTDAGSFCRNAGVAKASAFVYLVGLDGNGDQLDGSGVFHGTIRQGYRNRALHYLKFLNAPGLNNAFDLLSYTGIGLLTDYIAAGVAWNKAIYRASELQHICQTWDMLRWCYNVDPNLPNDNTIREFLVDYGNHIKTEYVVPLHMRAQKGVYNAHNNYVLIVGAALASAAICFHDYGTYFFLFDTRPNRWANSAYYNIHNTMWDEGGFYDNRMSMPGNLYGYAEGTYYFQLAFQNLIPMFLARYNFAPDNTVNSYNSFVLDPFPNYVRNFWHDEDYNNLYKWYNNLIQSDGKAPTIDDSYPDKEFNTAMAILRNRKGVKYNFLYELGSLTTDVGYSLKEDWLAALTPPIKRDLPQSIKMPSGDAVIRSRVSDEKSGKGKHYLYISAETESAKSGGWHEHSDFGSFIITADDDILMMDPPLFSKADGDIDGIEQHNTLNLYGAYSVSSSGINDVNAVATMSTTMKFNSLGGIWKRTFFVNRESNDINDTLAYHYVVFDEVHPYSSNSNFSFNFNGNGESSTHNNSSNGLIDWTYPCTLPNPTSHWGIRAIMSSSVPSYTSFNLINDAKHGTDGSLTNTIGNPLDQKGNHTRYTANINYPSPFTLTTLLQPRKCLGYGSVGKTTTRSSTKYSAVLLYDDDSIKTRKLYVGKSSSILDTIINPFNIVNGSILKTNAKITYMSYGEDTVQNFGYCPAYSKFRSASIHFGDSLIYNNKAYIISNEVTTASYKLAGKYKYQGYINSDSDVAVSFYLPDLDSTYKMKATNADTLLIHHYDDTAHVMTLFVKAGVTNFVLDLDNPCVLNCYFPYTTDSIKNTFDFNNGLVETLPHKLTITTPNGLLNINSGSCMSICPGKWLRNTDSLILEGSCLIEESKPAIVKCFDVNNPELRPTLKVIGGGAGGRPSTIIVNEQAALILDSGSYTRIGNNTTITVRPQGTLIIRKNAKVDIGDETGCGYGLIICYDDSYIHFEDSADIKFWKVVNDTADIHKFYIFLKPPTPMIPAHGGIESSIAYMLNTVDTNIHVGTSVPICNISQIKPVYGINNREWGWANFALPKAWAFLPKITFCPGECPVINFDASLNNVKFSADFYRIDTSYYITPHDSLVLMRNPYFYIGGAVSNCDTIKDIPVLKICDTTLTTSNYWYKVRIKVKNDCDVVDSIDIHYFMLKSIDASFSMNNTACIDSVIATENTDSFTHLYREKTLWHVHYIDTASALGIYTQKINYGADWEYLGIDYPNTFTFPDFKWIGGFYYAISHTVSFKGCGSKIVWDTVFVAPGANIVLRRPITYNQTISGNRSVQLKGYVSNADSFNWNPSTWLDSTTSLTPICTPNDSITYILTAYKDGCTARDTAHIKYNRYANAGYSDTLCFDSTHSTETLVGFPYDMSLFLGMLYYYDNTQFMNYYNNYNTGNLANYFRYFTHYMHTQNFENATTPCPVNLFNVFTSTMNKEMFFKKPWFKTFYQSFTSFSDPNLPALDDFKNTVTSDTPLKDHLDSLNNWGNIDPCMDNLFNMYNDYVQNHVNEISTSWSRITDGDTSTLTSWNNYFVAVDAPAKSSKYLLSVIAPSVAEIDEITILVDTLLTPLFAPAMQFDSTVYLMNYTEPVSTATHYEWNFGDGSTHSFETHPIHTFPAFDSNYVVCLVASNLCSAFTYCDTVRIDSLHLGGVLFAKKQPAFYENNPTNETVSKQATSKTYQLTNNNIQLSNYPNPFNNSTIIDYEIWQNYTNAELRITNVLGQTLFTQKLNKPIDKIQVDGGALSNGIYYYSIIVDGTVSQTRSMSVIH